MNRYYKALNLKEGVSEEEIKKRYRELSKKYHPDLNPDDKKAEEKFKEINEAYTVLTGKEKPKEQFRQQGNPFGGGSFMRKGRTIEVVVEIPLKKAYKGGKHQITFNVVDMCEHCNGAGGKNPKQCNQCGGTGFIKQGIFVHMCNNCQGTGTLFMDPCNHCGTSGTKNSSRTVDLELEKSTTDKTVAVTRGMGNYVRGGRNGDVIFIIKIKEDPIFKLEGLNVKRKIDVPILDIFLGTNIEFETLDGNVRMDIPKLSEPTKTFRLRGKGFIDNKTGTKGNMYVTINPTLPKELTTEEENLIKQLKKKIYS